VIVESSKKGPSAVADLVSRRPLTMSFPMRTQNSPSRSDFVRGGFVVLRHFMDGSELADMQAAVESLVASPPDSACSRPNNTLLPFRWNNPIFRIALACKHRVQALAEAVDAHDLKWISGYVSIKEPRSPALWWHQDWWCWDHPVSYLQASPQMALLCYLNATSPENGALRILPGSHHSSSAIHACLPQANVHGAVDIGPSHIAMSDHADQATLSLNAGDAVAIDYRLLHGTHGNASDVRRDCIILNFAPSWRDLPDDIQGHLICHPALPSADELAAVSWEAGLLPAFSGTRRDLSVNRIAPHNFQIIDPTTSNQKLPNHAMQLIGSARRAGRCPPKPAGSGRRAPLRR
jgi:ectoine hydroxylase-related dioxygenase (phytanoyl-CoA dioxygenase family)